jgi:molybdopterin synthase sulfur carrier subunit
LATVTAVRIRIPAPLRPLTGGLGEVTAEPGTLLEAIRRLDATYPGLSARIFDEAGRVREFVNVFVNEEDVRFLDGPQTVLRAGDRVSILPAVAGGSGR